MSNVPAVFDAAARAREWFRTTDDSVRLMYEGEAVILAERAYAAGVAEERGKRAVTVYRLKMARFVLAGLPNMFPETRRSNVVRRMIEIIDATLAKNTDFDGTDEDFDAALRGDLHKPHPHAGDGPLDQVKGR